MRALILMLISLAVAVGVGLTLAPLSNETSDMSDQGDYPGPKVGSVAPNFTYRTIGGSSVSKKDFAGKVLLVDVFSVT